MGTNYVGKRIYYNPSSGVIVYNTGDRSGTDIVKSTVKEDFQYVLELKEYAMNDLKYIELEFGEQRDDFENCIYYRVNPETEQLEFTYRENQDNTKPLVVQFEELKAENLTMLEMIATLQEEQSYLRAELENMRSNAPEK